MPLGHTPRARHFARAVCGFALSWGLGLSAQWAAAAPILPASDDEVIETLPALPAGRAEMKRLRKSLAQRPQDEATALALARSQLNLAHETGDPRFAGTALAAIAAWSDEDTMPGAVLLMRANLQQYLHQFDAAAASLQKLLARPSNPSPAQGWLTLATVRRVQGRYADSDRACEGVARAGASLFARACLAENQGLRGRVDEARAGFEALLAEPNPPATQAWLRTSLAELEQRAGHADAAERQFRTALALDADPYTRMAYADLLIDTRRPAQALGLLKGEVRSDAVLLRLAIAGKQAQSPGAQADALEMRERIALANERPDAKIFHGREQALFALAIEGDARRALALAQGNVTQQREPLDLLVLARAARASGDAAAIAEAGAIARQMGLVDQRLKETL